MVKQTTHNRWSLSSILRRPTNKYCMNNNYITLHFKGTNDNGFPSVKISYDNKLLVDYTLESEEFSYSIPIGPLDGSHIVSVERYNKTEKNINQILEITEVKVDNITIPDFFLMSHSVFKFNNETHQGSRYFGPNGIWSLTFYSPLITYILDQKILHESKYNQDYIYPWSYKLGPDSVTQISKNIKFAIERISKL